MLGAWSHGPAGRVPLHVRTCPGLAETMSQVLGKEVRFQQITFEAYKDRFVRLGMSDAMAQGYADL